MVARGMSGVGAFGVSYTGRPDGDGSARMTGCSVAATAVDGGLSRSLAQSTVSGTTSLLYSRQPVLRSTGRRSQPNARRSLVEGKLISSRKSTGAAPTSPSIGKDAVLFRNHTVWLVDFR